MADDWASAADAQEANSLSAEVRDNAYHFVISTVT